MHFLNQVRDYGNNILCDIRNKVSGRLSSLSEIFNACNNHESYLETTGSHGCHIWLQMRKIWDFFSSYLSSFWLGKRKCTELLFEKVPDVSQSDIPVPNNSLHTTRTDARRGTALQTYTVIIVSCVNPCKAIGRT